MNIMTGAHKTPDMLAINPWHQMPNMTDGDVSIGESGAIVRYIAETYNSFRLITLALVPQNGWRMPFSSALMPLLQVCTALVRRK